MKTLQKIILLALLLVSNAYSEPPASEPAGERWEVVTDIYIGVQTEKLTPEEREGYGEKLPPYQGLRIKRVIPGSPAEKCGLMAGDVIISVSGGSTASMEDLLLCVRNIRPGDRLYFSVIREGSQRMVPVRVEALPEPVVVAYATLAVNTPPNVEAMAANQRRIAELLSEETPDFQAIHAEFLAINKLFPVFGRPGQVRLYYETDFGYLTVTDFPVGLLVTVQREQSSETYRLQKQGDKLPAHVVESFAKLPMK